MILCADDFGLNDPVSEGILQLADKGKVNAISCLAAASCWKNRAADLKPFFGKVELGLHLSLTHPKPLHLPRRSLFSLARAAYLGQIDKAVAAREIEAQIAAFRAETGRFPDYVDGHEFCHHLPKVRAALAAVSEKFSFREKAVYVRVFSPGRLPFLKNPALWLGNYLSSRPSKALAALLKERNIPRNRRLLGFHPYRMEPKKCFEYYLAGGAGAAGDVFFCHPGLKSNDGADSLSDYRPKVLDFMMSLEFGDFLKSRGITLKNRYGQL